MPVVPATSAFAWKAGAGLGQSPPLGPTPALHTAQLTGPHFTPPQSPPESPQVHLEPTLSLPGWVTRPRRGRWRRNMPASTGWPFSPSASTRFTRGGKQPDVLVEHRCYRQDCILRLTGALGLVGDRSAGPLIAVGVSMFSGSIFVRLQFPQPTATRVS